METARLKRPNALSLTQNSTLSVHSLNILSTGQNQIKRRSDHHRTWEHTAP